MRLIYMSRVRASLGVIVRLLRVMGLNLEAAILLAGIKLRISTLSRLHMVGASCTESPFLFICLEFIRRYVCMQCIIVDYGPIVEV